MLQLFNEGIQLLAFHHTSHIVRRNVDAVVGNTRLGVIIGADLLGAFTCANLGTARRVKLILAFFVCQILKAGFEDADCA